ncbi:hypothetical protein [Colwellia psychrerythraea]|nr:hypothetical protein [Colwellia psychrerythraea]
MADGADLLAIQAAEELWHDKEWPKESFRIIPCLPMEQSAFTKDFSEDSLFTVKEFEKTLDDYKNNQILLRHGLTQEQYNFALTDMNYGEWRNSLYLNLGVFIAKYSNVLLALWDDEKSDGLGGTGDVVKIKCGVNAKWPEGAENKALSHFSDFDGQLGGVVHHIPVIRKEITQKTADNIELTRVDKSMGKAVFPTEHQDCKLYVSHNIAQGNISSSTNLNQTFLTEEFVELILQLNKYNNQELSSFDISSVNPKDEEELEVQQISLGESFSTFKSADKTAENLQTNYRSITLWFVFFALSGFVSYELTSAFLDKPLGLILNSMIIIAIITGLLIKRAANKKQSKWHFQIARGIAESMRLRGFLNLANIAPTSSPLIPRRYRKKLPILNHAIEVTELHWWKNPIQQQLNSVSKHWLNGQIGFLQARLDLSKNTEQPNSSTISKLLSSVNPNNIKTKLKTFFYKRPARAEVTLTKWTTILFWITCLSVISMWAAQIILLQNDTIKNGDLSTSNWVMFGIQFSLLLTAVTALWNELANYGHTANGYLNLLQLYKRADQLITQEITNSNIQPCSKYNQVLEELKFLNKKIKNTDPSNCSDLYSAYKDALSKIEIGLEQPSEDMDNETIENLLIELAKEAMQEHAEWNHFESLSDLKNKK